MTVRALYAWELVRDGAVRERGTLAEGARVAVGPTGLAREGQGPILPWHARLAVTKGRLLAASGDARNPAMLGSLRLPSDFTRIEVPNAVRVGAFELRISAAEPDEVAPDTSRTGDEATVMGRVEETLVGRASGAVPAASMPPRPTPVPATTREPSLAPAPARRPSSEVAALRAPEPVAAAPVAAAPAPRPVEGPSDADRSMMTRLEPIQLVRPRTLAARDAHEGLRDTRTPAHEAHALAASGSGPVAVTRMSEHPPIAPAVRPLSASGSGAIAVPLPSPNASPPYPSPYPHPNASPPYPHPNASPPYPHPNASPPYPAPYPYPNASPPAPAPIAPSPNASPSASALPHAPPAYLPPTAAWTPPPAPTPPSTPTTPPQAWVAEAARTARPTVPPAEAAPPAPARPRRVVVAIAAGGVAAAAVLFALSAMRPGLVASNRPPGAEPTAAATSPTFRRVGAAPAESAVAPAPKAPAPVPSPSPAARATRDEAAERRIAKALLAGDSAAATTEANALAAAHPDVTEYRTMRRALRRMTPPSTAD